MGSSGDRPPPWGGIARTTVDVDVLLMLPQEQLPALLVRFEHEGFRVPPGALVRLAAGALVKLAFTRRFSVALHSASLSLDHRAIQRAREARLFGIPLGFVSPEDLMIYKLARWEPIDERDVRGILEGYRDRLDRDYIQVAVQELAQGIGFPELMERWNRLKEEIAG